jgi:hypothetical protein
VVSVEADQTGKFSGSKGVKWRAAVSTPKIDPEELGEYPSATRLQSHPNKEESQVKVRAEVPVLQRPGHNSHVIYQASLPKLLQCGP